ncbi:MAG: hypothetical protein EKK46_05300 [Rhodocyclaceae bacterium]|nr:MAG: hypothetical protein EKK46_05300 [Rhodocyclaceae bacterium]
MAAEAFDKLKSLLRSPLLVSAKYYLLVNIVSGAIPFLMLPVLTRYLSPEDFGTVAIYTTLSAVISALFTLGVNGAISRIYFDLTEDKFAEFIGTCMVLVACSAAVITIVMFLLADLITGATKFPSAWLWAVAITACAQSAINVALSMFQVRGLVRQFAVVQLSQSLLLAIFTLVLVAGLSFDWRGRVVAQAISSGAAGCAVVFALIRYYGVPVRFEAQYGCKALRYGLPLVVHVLSGIAISLVDRFIIARLLTLRDTGLYAAAGQVTAALIFVIDAFNRAYAPWLFSALASNDLEIRHKVIRGTYIYFVVVWLVSMLFAFVMSRLMGLFLGEKYIAASTYIVWMAAAAAFMGMYYMVTLYIQYSKRTEYLATITLSVGIFNVILCYAFVDLWGGIGAAYASTTAQACMFFLSWLVAARLVPMPWFGKIKQP